MAVTFQSSATGATNTTPFTEQHFTILGDGVTPTLSLDLAKSPVGLVFAGGNTPTVVVNQSGNSIIPTISGSTLTLSLAGGFPTTAVGVVLDFFYP